MNPTRVGCFAFAVSFAALDLSLAAQSTTRVDVSASGQQLPAGAIWPEMTPDGRFVAFVTSDAPALDPLDTNGHTDVFVKDLQTGTVVLASVTASGVLGNGSCFLPKLSADGRYVAFSTFSSNLAPSDANGTGTDVFVKDLTTGALEHVSKDNAGVGGNGTSAYHEFSRDGRFVSFYSYSTNFVANDTNGNADVFVFDRQTQTIECVSVDSNGVPSLGGKSALSDDGRFVAFLTTGATVGLPAGGGVLAVRDRFAGTVTAVNMISPSIAASASNPRISGDGSVVVFETPYRYVPADADNVSDVYAITVATGACTLVSRSPGASSNEGAFVGGVSTHGRFVTFSSYEAFDPSDTNGLSDAFVADLLSGTVERVSTGLLGVVPDSGSAAFTVSESGRFVLLSSNASNLVSGDTNGLADVFVRDRVPAATSAQYGTGLPGTGGVVPTLSMSPPAIGTVATLDLGNTAGAPTLGLLILGSQQVALPSPWQGTFLASADLIDVVGLPALGYSQAVAIPDVVDLAGAQWFLQGLVLDGGAAAGVAFSPGLAVTIGG